MELLASEATLLISLLAGFSNAAGFQKGLHFSEDSLPGKKNLLRSLPGIPEAMAPSPDPQFPLILAAKRTRRPDILHGFHLYGGGWNITNRHYWMSAGFTGAAGIILSFLWFFIFGIALAVNSCCRWRIKMRPKKPSCGHPIRLVLLVAFTCSSL